MQFNLKDFAEFAKSKPSEERYDPWDSQVCALAQFAQACFVDADIIAGFNQVQRVISWHEATYATPRMPGMTEREFLLGPDNAPLIAERVEEAVEKVYPGCGYRGFVQIIYDGSVGPQYCTWGNLGSRLTRLIQVL